MHPALLLAQFGEWTWIHGSNASGSAGNFGIMGVPSPANEPPAVYEPCEWTDLNGNFWVYGGWGSTTRYACLWKYDVATNEWTWMKGPAGAAVGVFGTQGVSAPANHPPGNSHGALSWTDNSGNLWMFGGGGAPSSLWRYTISTNEWTWMKGPSSGYNPGTYGVQGVPSPANEPGDRWECAATWTDNSNNLWFFGGTYNNSNLFNDLWRYDVSTNEWTWMNGSPSFNQPAAYGTLGVEDTSNNPGGRIIFSRWKDKNGNFWLFGGGDNVNFLYRNDMWRYNPLTNSWTWMNGSNTFYTPGVYGIQCQGGPASSPGARIENRVAMTDTSGNFWLFGGGASAGGGTFVNVWNDLWMYCVAQNEWIWAGNDNMPNTAGSWGTIGISDPSNKPNGRAGAVGGIDLNNTLYLFGGSSTGFNQYNDLWKFIIDPACGLCIPVLPVAVFTSPNNTICPGTCTDFTNLSVNSTSFLWEFTGANPATSTDQNPTAICYNQPGSYDVTLIASNANGSDTLVLANYITVFPQPSPQGITQSGDTLFAIPGFVSYQWYFNGTQIAGATNYFYVASISGDYNIVATDDNGCEVEAVIYNVIADVPSTADRGMLTVYPNPVRDKIVVGSSEFGETVVEISIYNVFGQLAAQLQTKNYKLQTSIDVSELPPGMYLIELDTGDEVYHAKFMKQ